MAAEHCKRWNDASVRLARLLQCAGIALLIHSLALPSSLRADPIGVDANGTLTGDDYFDPVSYSGADVKKIDSNANVVLGSSGQIVNLNGGAHDALANSLLENYGFLDIENPAERMTLNHPLTNHGQLSVGSNLTLGDFTNSSNLEVWGGPAHDLTVGGNFTNMQADGTLSGGDNFYIDSDNALKYTGADIKAIAAGTVLTLANTAGTAPGSVLNLAGGSHDAVLNTLTSIYGTFSVQQNSALTLTGNVTNYGRLKADLNGQLTLGGGLTNIDGNGVLSGGAYLVGSTSSLIYSGADIQTIDANTKVTFTNDAQTSSGQILNLTGGSHDAFAATLKDNYGTLEAYNNAQLTLSQGFTNHNSVYVDTGGNVTFAGALNNIDGDGTLLSGNYVIGAGASLTYTGSDIHTIGAGANLAFDNSSGNTTGQILNLNGGSHDALAGSLTDNFGLVSLSNGAQLGIAPGFTNHDGGSLNVYATSQFTTNGTLNNAGSLYIEGTVSGKQGVQQSGSVYIAQGGELGLGSGATFTQTAGTTTVDGTLDPQSIDIFGGLMNGTGTLEGDVVVDNGGILSPGENSAGTMTVDGSYRQNLLGELDITVGGTGQGTDYSFLDVDGGATLGGILNLSLINDFDPLAGETFTILHAGSISGAFSSSSWAGLAGNLTYSLIYGTNDVEVLVSDRTAATPEPASFALFGGAIVVAGFLGRRRRKTQESA